jgi:hypothetical protein
VWEPKVEKPAEVIDDTEGTTRGGFLFQILLEQSNPAVIWRHVMAG